MSSTRQNVIKKAILILAATSLLTWICFAQGTGKERTGKIIFDNVYKEGSIFVFEYEKGIEHSPNALMELRDAMLSASPLHNQVEVTVKEGRYIIGLKLSVPAGDSMIYEIGKRASENILLAPTSLLWEAASPPAFCSSG
jgi:hypothetical protein